MPVSAESEARFIKQELIRLYDIYKEVVNTGNNLTLEGREYRVIWDELNEVFCLQVLHNEYGWDTIFIKLPEKEESFR